MKRFKNYMEDCFRYLYHKINHDFGPEGIRFFSNVNVCIVYSLYVCIYSLCLLYVSLRSKQLIIITACNANNGRGFFYCTFSQYYCVFVIYWWLIWSVQPYHLPSVLCVNIWNDSFCRVYFFYTFSKVSLRFWWLSCCWPYII